MKHAFVAALLASTVLCAPVPAAADNHALILGIFEYARSPLPGAADDIGNAKEIARQIGVPDKNIVVKKDRDLTLNGLKAVVADFSKRIKDGDRVFIYFSGHGTSYSNREGRCEKALVTQEHGLLVKEDFHRTVNDLAKKTDKTFVFLDSCFSGGLVQASHSKAAARDLDDLPVAKANTSTPDDPCFTPSNMSKASRDFGMEAAAATPNYFLLTASGESEVAIATSHGSLATSAVAACLKERARADGNKDGVVTLDEVRTCAQNQVDGVIEQSSNRPNYPFTAMTLTHGFGPGGNPPVSFVGGPQPVNTASFAQTLYDARNATRQVSLRADKNPVRIGDYLNLEVTSDRPGYLTLMVVGSSGKIYQIFPNQMDGDARVEAGKPMPVPHPERWKMPANPPAGDNWFLALVSDTPDRFKGLGERAGIFTGFGNSGDGAKGIVERIINPAQGCTTASRDFGMEALNPCSTGYGAALIKVTEVN